MKKLFFVYALCAMWCADTSAQQYNIVDFGAKTDTTILNTKAIQAAIDQCHAKGGGEVIVPAGRYFTGTVFLKSNVYLNLLPGSVLQGSYDPKDYPDHVIRDAQKFGTITHNGMYVESMKAIIIADKAAHTGITGTGAVRGAGDGKAFQLGINKEGRPKNLFFIGCTDVLLKGIQVLNSAQITISISRCERVNVDGIYLRSMTNWNCDGLDMDAKDATIANCVIDAEDDALCFKSEYLGAFCENITVTNCVLSSLCNGIKFGTGSRTGFRNITVSNCVIKKASFNGYRHWEMTPDIVFKPEEQSVNTGIVIQGVDGGIVENIRVSDIIMTDVLSPIFIRAGARFLNPEGKPSVIRNIDIRNVTAVSRSVIPSIIAGLDGSPVENVRLSGFHITVPIGVGADVAKTFPLSPPESVKGYPENRLTFGTKLPASGFYIRHAKGVALSDVSTHFPAAEARPVFVIDDAERVDLKEITVNGQRLKDKRGMVTTIASKAISIH